MAYAQYCLICDGSACNSNESERIHEQIMKYVYDHNLEHTCQVVKTGCFGFCQKGPIVKVLPDEAFYVQVQPQDAAEIVREHLLRGRPVNRLLFRDRTSSSLGAVGEISFYRRQVRIVLRNCGFIDPENINEYIGREGYLGLEKALFDMTPEEVLHEVEVSGLRGRGGGGFPTGTKWRYTRETPGDQKYVVCNADEGDPGAYMDRSILEGDPHSIIEAMAICGYTVGASRGYVYVRAEYPMAIRRLEKALVQAREHGLLGENILGSSFSFDIEIRLGAGAFVCGEETALLMSIEGKRGMPVQRPPYPAVKGLWGKPTVINNVETLGSIPVIITRGGEWLASIGTKTSKGTKVFALTGNVNNTGLIEVPMGTTLRDIVFDIGGGIPGGKAFKAVQSGGPSGGMIPAEHMDTPIDYESLAALGSIMGSGGLIVLDEDDSMVDVAKFYLGFTVDESCGKCVPCRVGGRQIEHLLEKFIAGEGTAQDLERMESLGQTMKKASLCGLGKTAPNPVLSSIKFFRHEYEAAFKKNVAETA